ncbi:hypothetical protein KUTeg_015119 [Tegillarca granosa]|uniref:Uncharacterized protein n=1 Tax=Tegillarca granosa TaxID=220873 RepID=A0ABQ9EUF8_TEGGR|nr:hypothetical protein KUTeg_015119 [Tegillarca granosa]
MEIEKKKKNLNKEKSKSKLGGQVQIFLIDIYLNIYQVNSICCFPKDTQICFICINILIKNLAAMMERKGVAFYNHDGVKKKKNFLQP